MPLRTVFLIMAAVAFGMAALDVKLPVLANLTAVGLLLVTIALVVS